SQAEDGIRDFHVTGVQTCALPISMITSRAGRAIRVTGVACGLRVAANTVAPARCSLATAAGRSVTTTVGWANTWPAAARIALRLDRKSVAEVERRAGRGGRRRHDT